MLDFDKLSKEMKEKVIYIVGNSGIGREQRSEGGRGR